jgi:thioredoxin reductase (NADPH)
MGADGLMILATGVVLTVLITIPFWVHSRRREAEAVEWEARATDAGLHVPVTLHPVVDPAACIGSGTCVSVCPEDVLALRGGQAVAVAAARCVGHGLCERACPVDAIQLVFGTATRGVELPRIREDFQSNVPGLYIIGELGGMGLIANAFEQAAQCVSGITGGRDTHAGGNDGLVDLAIVGCGPAGLAASLHARERGLTFETLEKEPDVGGAVRSYPRRKLVMTREIRVPGFGTLRTREIPKEELIDVWEEIVVDTGLDVRTGVQVTGVRREDDGSFTLESTMGAVRSRGVILALGRRGTPRKLGVPGEDRPHVAYSLREAEAYRDLDLLVVGGGDSAVEAALALAGAGNRVMVSYRGEAFSRIKPANLERVHAAMAEGSVHVLWSTEVREINEDVIVIETPNGPRRVPADAVFIFIGGLLPTRFLQEAGVEIDTKFGAP